MSSYNLHRAFNITKNTIGYCNLMNAMILKFLDSGFEIISKTDDKLTVETTDNINGDPMTICLDCLDEIINEYHDEIENELEKASIIRGYLDREVLGSTSSMIFVIPIPDSKSYQILL